jgi:basic amino acid/polyamine antiporter, APA family
MSTDPTLANAVTTKPEQTAGPTDGSRVFTRQSSGLVRELGIPTSVGVALGSVIVISTFINFYAGLTGFTKADMILPLLVAAAIWTVALFAYRYLIEAMPRDGGEYLFLSRVVSPVAGAMVGIGMVVFFAYQLSAVAHYAAQWTPFMLTTLGDAFSSSSVANAANNVTGHTAILLIGVGTLLVCAVGAFLPVRQLGRLLIFLVALQALAFVVLGVLLIDHSHADFVAAFARFSHHPNAYSSVITAASQAGIPLGTSFIAMLGLIPVMVLNFNGSLYSYYMGGELRRPTRTYSWASAISIGVLVVLWLGIWLLMRHTIGLHFMQAQSNLGNSDATQYGKISTLEANAGGLGYGVVLSGDPVTKILLGTAIPLSSAATVIVFIAVLARVLFALAFDRLLPIQVAKVSARNHAPTVAIIIALLGGLAFTVVTTYVDLTNIVANLALFYALILLAGAIACTFLPLRRPDLVLRPGETDVPRWGPVPRATLVGGATALLAALTVVLIITNASVFGALTVASITSLIVIFLSGPVIYAIARTVRRRQGSIDLNLAFRQLPPE